MKDFIKIENETACVVLITNQNFGNYFQAWMPEQYYTNEDKSKKKVIWEIKFMSI